MIKQGVQDQSGSPDTRRISTLYRSIPSFLSMGPRGLDTAALMSTRLERQEAPLQSSGVQDESGSPELVTASTRIVQNVTSFLLMEPRGLDTAA